MFNATSWIGSELMAISTAADPEALEASANAARRCVAGVGTLEAGSLALTGAASAIGDAITERAIRLLTPAFRLPPAAWCWLGLGSEGRGEQTLVTDQDNALIFVAEGEREADELRRCFLPFAAAVNGLLARCGMPLCDGGVMAGNARCCLSTTEWRERFQRWIRLPEPESLLNATIFFDFRPLYGEQTLADELRTGLTDAARGADIFLHMLAENCVQVEVPLGRLRKFNLDDAGYLDLKKFGSRLFVDAARVLALANDVDAVGTVARLWALGARAVIDKRDAEAACEAFAAIQALRWENQRLEQGNLVSPASWSGLRRGTLLLGLRQARELQSLLKARFSIDR